MAENKFNVSMDKLMDRPVLGFPLRLIFLEKWHKINAFLFVVGLLILVAEKFFVIEVLKPIGAILVTVPLICFALLFILVILFLTLEKIFPQSQPADS